MLDLFSDLTFHLSSFFFFFFSFIFKQLYSRSFYWMYDTFPSRLGVQVYMLGVTVGLTHPIRVPLIKISHCMSIVILPPLGELPKMNFPFQPLLSPPQGEELKSRAARVAKKSFPCSRASYETDHRVERSEQAVKGRGRAEAEGGEKRAHAPDQSTTNGSPP